MSYVILKICYLFVKKINNVKKIYINNTNSKASVV